MYKAKPFIKWAGGKSQLLKTIYANLPDNILDGNFTYVEPFLGSGAVMFFMLNNFKNIENLIVNDLNTELINTYKTIQNIPDKLIEVLTLYQTEYHSIEKEEFKKEFYYKKRELFNSRIESDLIQSALFIFLNKTCFNGLYRVNSKNEFNVPIGSYSKPLISDAYNIKQVSNLIQKVTFLNDDFEKTLDYVKTNAFFYFDPPYKPISSTSSFNSYAKVEFDDKEQKRLKDFCKNLDILGHSWMLSNSDVNTKETKNDFFDILYNDYNIQRVNASRAINSKGSKRGAIKELLITNYEVELNVLY